VLFPSLCFATFFYYIRCFFLLDKNLPHLVCTISKEGLCSTLGDVDPHKAECIPAVCMVMCWGVRNVAFSLGAQSLTKS